MWPRTASRRSCGCRRRSRSEEHHALPAAQVREVREPQLVRAPAVKSRFTRSGRRRAIGSGLVVRHGLPRRLAPWIPCARISRWTWQRGDVLAGPQQRLPGPPVAIGAVVRLVHLTDPLEQPLVLDLRAERRPSLAGSKRTPTRPGSADRLDPEALTMLVDIRAHFGRCGSSSFAKNTLADFKISFARRNSKSSRRSFGSPHAPLVSTSLRRPSFGFDSAHVLPQRLRREAQITRNMRDRAARLEHQPRRALQQLLGILPRPWHTEGSPPPRTKPRNQASATTGPAHRAVTAAPGPICLGFRRYRAGRPNTSGTAKLARKRS